MENHTKESVAERLASSHFHVDPAIEEIYRVNAPGREDDPAEPVKLLEVNRDTPAQGIVPIRFGVDSESGIFYPSIIIEIRPEELADIRAGALPLPNDWKLGSEIKRRPVEAA